ncbi:hypothetical protein [Tateyamaria sp. SN3-11]|uniref:hypothetical protein n=1 Tax=Tateyamaria sp. SN3-11 TaxID=3092147 RepID=UPI0039E777AB
MLYTPLLDTFSIACIAVLLGLSTVMYRRHVSATKHALALAGLCGVVLAAWVVSETLTLNSSTPEILPPTMRPLSVVSGLTVPLLILLCLGAWHTLTHRWQAASQRLLSYTIHWIIVLGWVAVSLLEPTNIFAMPDTLSDLSEADLTAFMQQNNAAAHLHKWAVLGYLGLAVSLFVLPLLVSFRRTS